MFESVPLIEEQHAQYRVYVHYLSERMRPAIQALLILAIFSYLAVTLTIALVTTPTMSLAWRLMPTLPLILVAGLVRIVRKPLSVNLLALSCVALLVAGLNLNAMGLVHGLDWVMPGSLILAVASPAISSARWILFAAMILCVSGPVPLLLLGDPSSVEISQYVLYMAIALCLSYVLHTFLAQAWHAQFALQQRLREQARTDGLTGLMVRNHFLEFTRSMLVDLQAARKSAWLIYLDADHFKKLNDGHGHAAGDAALVALAGVLHRQLRVTDPVGRLGGEEFAVFLPDLDVGEAHYRAERLRLAVRGVQRPDGPLTVSIGMAQSRHAEGIESLLARADQALRQAKADGRDRVVSYD